MPGSGPLYQRIAADLRRAITSGELSPGSQLPTEQELGERYGVSRNTVRLALAQLTNEGVIAGTQGRGTFVRERLMTTYHARWAESRDRPASDRQDAYRAEVEAQGQVPSYGYFEMRVVPADAELAERLRVEEDAGLVVRSITRMVNDEPSSLQDSYYPMDIAQQAGLLNPRDLPQGAIRAMADHGYIEVGYVDEITTRMPTPDEVRRLRLTAGVPVIVYVRTSYTDKRPARLTKTTMAGDRNRIVYEIGDVSTLTAEEDR